MIQKLRSSSPLTWMVGCFGQRHWSSSTLPLSKADHDDLVDQKRLHATCREIFRRGKTVEHPLGVPLRLHRHQEKAIECAQKGVNYVLTTGTGSGKSLAYLIPIIDHVLKTGSGNGIKAIVVYPMNALANSQLGEMEKFLGPGFPTDDPPVRFARYTGQENEEARDAILEQSSRCLADQLRHA